MSSIGQKKESVRRLLDRMKAGGDGGILTFRAYKAKKQIGRCYQRQWGLNRKLYEIFIYLRQKRNLWD